MLRLCLFAFIAQRAFAAFEVPPMGWRSWNAFQLDVDQGLMEKTVDAMTNKLPSGSSLLDAGYDHVGLDDGWQMCGAGVNGSFHSAAGRPLVNETRFPDMAAMTAYAHRKGVKMGWYANNCYCRESGLAQGGFVAGDVTAMLAFGFDGIKVDGCGPEHNISLWVEELARQTTTPIMLENCGDNHAFWSPPDVATVAAPDCKFPLYRISQDIAPQFESAMWNLNHLLPYLAANASRPGCWAYPDMLQVGRLASTVESRTHFSAWVVTSSPLVLGLDITNASKLAPIAPILTNPRAIAVSQHYAGAAGHLVRNATTTVRLLVAHGADGDPTCRDVLQCDQWDAPTWQAWAKPLHGGAVAVLVVNLDRSSTLGTDIALTFEELGLPADATAVVTDVHTGKVTTTARTLQVPTIGGRDSFFVVLKP